MPAKNVLLVDAAEAILTNMASGLASHSGEFQVLTASDTQKALQVLQSTTVDAVAINLTTPGMDAFELLATMCASFPSIPVLVISIFGDPHMNAKLGGLGPVRVLKRPVEMEDLAQAILATLQSEWPADGPRYVDIRSFVLLIEMERRTCLLMIKSPDKKRSGFLYFNKGDLHDAICGEQKGRVGVTALDEAAIEMLAWKNASFRFSEVPKGKLSKRMDAALIDLVKAGVPEAPPPPPEEPAVVSPPPEAPAQPEPEPPADEPEPEPEPPAPEEAAPSEPEPSPRRGGIEIIPADEPPPAEEEPEPATEEEIFEFGSGRASAPPEPAVVEEASDEGGPEAEIFEFGSGRSVSAPDTEQEPEAPAEEPEAAERGEDDDEVDRSVQTALDELVDTDAITAAIIVGLDGFVIESAGTSVGSFDMEQLGASVSMLQDGASKMGHEMKVSPFATITLESDDALIMCTPVGDALLVVLGPDSKSLGMVRLRTKKFLPALRELF